MAAHPRPDPATALTDVAALASRSFASSDEALVAVFETMRRLLGMRSLFLSRIDADRRTFRIVASANDVGGCDVAVGDESSLDLHY